MRKKLFELILERDFSMKKRCLVKLLCFSLAVLYFELAIWSTGALGQKREIIKLGVVNFEEITRKSLMSKDIARQFAQKRKEFREEIAKEEKNLRKANEDIQRQRVLLSPEALEKKIQTYKTSTVALQRKVQKRNQEFIKIRAYGTREFEKERAKALLDVTKANRLTLVFSERALLYRAEYLDITNSVLNALNKRKKSFKIPEIIPGMKN